MGRLAAVVGLEQHRLPVFPRLQFWFGYGMHLGVCLWMWNHPPTFQSSQCRIPAMLGMDRSSPGCQTFPQHWLACWLWEGCRSPPPELLGFPGITAQPCW